MKTVRTLSLTMSLMWAACATAAGPSDTAFDAYLESLQHEFDVASFQAHEDTARKEAFAALLEHADELAGAFPDRVEAVAWKGIVLSAYAGEVRGMSAMKYAKAARAALDKAERMDPDALDGGIYASLGALYSKVPGGIIGFGDDDLAAEYFAKALAADPYNLDSNFFYGEFLIEQGEHAKAMTVLARALEAPPLSGRPVFDAGRRAEIRALLERARR